LCVIGQVTAEHDYTLALADPRAAQTSVGGGKASSLARLSAAGLPVPTAFVVTTGAYQPSVSGTHPIDLQIDQQEVAKWLELHL
jgi:phosphoenolpyruvate synthase/pyruvate phosphate dikinase